MTNQTVAQTVRTVADVDLVVQGRPTVSLASAVPASVERVDPNLFDNATIPVVRITVDLPGVLDAVIEVPASAVREVLEVDGS